ncbi:YlbF family regulator [Jeotgalibaca caeni]|uniref:YlbF family regulator n=1 Tax=Jeotgalibaca caeni TaxID=3028623 RepID=UPI00237E1B4B|nr:YlbF family regulator [Jeotgalibaca caeni]MDE1548373.1 YlbF family regulator [Jeotgalibaca caeni]
MKNIYDIAYDLEKALREQPAFITLTEAYQKIQENEEASQLFSEFSGLQQELQMKQMSGQEISDEDIAHAQEVAGRASQDELIQQMMSAEQQLSVVIEDINKIIIKPLQEMYAGNNPTQE